MSLISRMSSFSKNGSSHSCWVIWTTPRRQIQSLLKKKTICKPLEWRVSVATSNILNYNSLGQIFNSQPSPRLNLTITMRALDTNTKYRAMNALTRLCSQSSISWKIRENLKIRTSMPLITETLCLFDTGQSHHHSQASITVVLRIKLVCASSRTQICFSSTVARKLKFKRKNKS